MPAFDGSGALALVGQNPIPQGTPDELRKLGVDPEKIGSCAPRSPGVHGCAVERDCRFHLQKLGGFKYQGPRNVGYYLRTHEGNQKEDFCTCHAFVRTLQARMLAGNAQRDAGNVNAEIIRIVAQEGGTIRQRVAVPIDPNNHNINAAYKFETRRIEVPVHPRPGDNTQMDYESELWLDELNRRNEDPEFATGPPPDSAFESNDEPFFDGEVLDLSGGATMAEEVPATGAKKK